VKHTSSGHRSSSFEPPLTLGIQSNVISANIYGLRDAASRPVDHITLHTMTELDIECIHLATAFVDTDSTLLQRPIAAGF